MLRAGQRLTRAGEGTGASHSLPASCFCEALGAPWAAEAKHGDGSGPGSAAAGRSGSRSPASGRKRQREPWSLRRTRSGGGRTRGGGGGRLGGGRSGPLARSGCSRAPAVCSLPATRRALIRRPSHPLPPPDGPSRRAPTSRGARAPSAGSGLAPSRELRKRRLDPASLGLRDGTRGGEGPRRASQLDWRRKGEGPLTRPGLEEITSSSLSRPHPTPHPPRQSKVSREKPKDSRIFPSRHSSPPTLG